MEEGEGLKRFASQALHCTAYGFFTLLKRGGRKKWRPNIVKESQKALKHKKDAKETGRETENKIKNKKKDRAGESELENWE